MTLSPVVAHILIITDVGTEHEVAKELRKMPGVTEVGVTYGEYDLIVKIVADNMAVLDKIVTDIRRHPNIIKTSTLFWAT